MSRFSGLKVRLPCTRRDAVCTLIVVGLAALLVVPALVRPSRLLYPSWSEYSDLALIHWPKATLVRETLADGQGRPWWSPGQLSGQPLAANQLAMLFYPPALLLLIGPLPWAFTLFYAVHLAWAGLGAYWLARGLGRPVLPALLAAAIVTMSGKLVAHTAIGHVSLVAAFAWAPWALVFLHRALTRRSLANALLAGLALAAQVVTHSYALIYTAYGLIVYTATFLLLAPVPETNGGHGRLRAAAGHLPRLAAIPAAAVLLGAAQLLPLIEMAAHSNRSLSFSEATLFSLSPLQTLTGVLFPAPSVGHEWTFYPGLLTLGLAAAAVLSHSIADWRRRVRDEWPAVALVVLVGAGIILALGDHAPAYGLAYRLLPGLSWLRTPARLWFFVTLGLAVLAAYGVEAWPAMARHPGRGRRARPVVVAATLGALMLSAAAVVAWHQTGRAAWGLGVFGLLSGGWLLWTSSRRAARRDGAALTVGTGLAVLLVAADLLSFDWTLFRLVPVAEALAGGAEPAAWLAARPGLFRTYSPSYSLPQPAVTQAGLYQIDGVEPVHLAAYDRFMAVAGGYGDTGFSVTIPPFPNGVPEGTDAVPTPDLGLLGLLNGRYVASAVPLDLPGLAPRWHQGDTWIYENEKALPRAWVVHRAEPEKPGASPDEQLARLQSLDLGRTAVVAGGPRLDGSGEASPARIVTYSPDLITVQADLAAPGLLVLSEIWYPGWQAQDNGRPVPIARTDAILRGVYLDAGDHHVEFRYWPWTVRIGLNTAVTATVLLLVYFAMNFRSQV